MKICLGRLYHGLPGYPVFPSLENAELECRYNVHGPEKANQYWPVRLGL